MERSSANKRPRTGEPSTMRAAVYHSFGGPIAVENVPRPKAPNGGVVLEVKATGVCRSDWHGWKGHDSDIVDHGLPFVPGHELSGIVSEVGTGVTNFAIGDRVAVPFILSCGHCRECARSRPTICESQQQPGFTIFGSFAEYVALPRADLNIAPLPAAVGFVAAAALGCRFTTAYRAVVQQGKLDASDAVAVFGCGGLGLSCVMLAAAHGAHTIIAVDTNPAARDKALSLGEDPPPRPCHSSARTTLTTASSVHARLTNSHRGARVHTAVCVVHRCTSCNRRDARLRPRADHRRYADRRRRRGPCR